MNLKIGDESPGFCLKDQNGEEKCLKDYKGSWVLVYFYPKDDTPGCTKEACSFRDNLAELNRLKLTVLGISKDTVASHKKFAEKYDLNFPILADDEAKTYNIYKINGRTSFLIDSEGKIAKIYENVKPEKHVGEVLLDYEKIMM
jgi:peroxiredoxin Q/BCP